MAGTDERGWRVPLWRHQRLLERDTLVPLQHGKAEPSDTVAVANRSGDVGDLVSAGLPLFRGSTQALKGFEEEGLDVMGLQPPRLGSFHVLADATHAARVHAVVNELPLFK